MSVSFPLDIFYDGSCAVCSREMEAYKKNNPDDRLHFIDISADAFEAEQFGKTQSEFMAKLHVRDAEGQFATGVEAFMLIWQAYPDGSLQRLLSAFVGFPGINLLARGSYAFFARYRHLLPKRANACDSGTCELKR